VRFAAGWERYTLLGQPGTVEHPEAGEVIFADETGLVFAQRWCWRQSDESAARESTTHAIITVEAHHDGAREDVEAALRDLLALLTKYAGGDYISAILDATQPALDDTAVIGIAKEDGK
jgi:DNA/RNA-binding domain of Phe-tRNA-synthetase-like protein